MLKFLQQNLATILVFVILICIVALVIRHLLKDSRSGVSWNCGCNCKECPFSSSCSGERFEEEKVAGINS